MLNFGLSRCRPPNCALCPRPISHSMKMDSISIHQTTWCDFKVPHHRLHKKNENTIGVGWGIHYRMVLFRNLKLHVVNNIKE